MNEPSPASGGQLVFGDDRSAGADLAWLWINSQRWPGWELVVLSADRPAFGGPPVAPEAAVPRTVAPTRPPFSEPGFASVTFQVATADPRVLLCSQDAAALVVVGPAGQGLGPWHVGSTTEWLLHGPPAPLVVARTGRPARRVVIAADGSDHSRVSIDAFVALPLAVDADVTVLTVDDGLADRGAAEAVVERLDGHGIAARASHGKGRPHRAVLAEATAGADLVVLGTRGLTGLRRLTLGSTASAVVRHAPCSVLVAHAGPVSTA